MTTSTRRPAWVVPAVAAHLLVTALVWRDLAARPAVQVRGPKSLWRLLSALSTSGSVGYLLLGRRRI